MYLISGRVGDEKSVPVSNGHATDDPATGHGGVHHRDDLKKSKTNRY